MLVAQYTVHDNNNDDDYDYYYDYNWCSHYYMTDTILPASRLQALRVLSTLPLPLLPCISSSMLSLPSGSVGSPAVMDKPSAQCELGALSIGGATSRACSFVISMTVRQSSRHDTAGRICYVAPLSTISDATTRCNKNKNAEHIRTIQDHGSVCNRARNCVRMRLYRDIAHVTIPLTSYAPAWRLASSQRADIEASRLLHCLM